MLARSGSPLADARYRRMLGAQVVSLLGSGLTTVALALLAHDLADGDAGVVLGIALALKMVAYVVVAPAVAGLLDRVPRRRLLVGLDLLRAAVAFSLPWVGEVWLVLLLVLVLSAGSAGFTPTFQSTIPDLLPDERTYTRALSLSRLAYELEQLASPVVAAIALLLVGYDVLFALNGVAFLLSAALVLSVVLPDRRPVVAAGSRWARVTVGVRRHVRVPRLRALLALDVAVAATGAMVIVNTVVLVRDDLGRSATADVAVALAAAGLGAILVTLALPRWLDRHGDRRVMLAGGGALPVVLVLAAGIEHYGSLLAVWVLAGGALAVVQTPTGRLLRRAERDGDGPALFAAHFSLSHACWLITYPLAGVLGTVAGRPTTALVLALLAAIAIIAATRLWTDDVLGPTADAPDEGQEDHQQDRDESGVVEPLSGGKRR
ncbi:MAG: MFS transporter [Solirubrobacteraceae bacterium]